MKIKINYLFQSLGTDTVELLTIHKSKGLEFQVVIFPFANWKMEEKPSKIWTKVPDHISQTIPYTLLPLRQNINPGQSHVKIHFRA